jgi:hypothetical protein
LSGAGRRGDNFVRFLAEVLFAEGVSVSVEGELVDLAFAADHGFAEAEIGID